MRILYERTMTFIAEKHPEEVGIINHMLLFLMKQSVLLGLPSAASAESSAGAC